ncbi:hypothetical protein EHP00_1594 [Ecytonucleospora hepatopenaei]|uniref:Uncharacterized protein n=1 Tax=Ecytonucleospora hepatopenaei TaxID=646526 RepID=A0A1W0E942_9MICR|nr:hypothetical protein EHP00_1594 [Ecytonucleospora hepatopenaei]
MNNKFIFLIITLFLKIIYSISVRISSDNDGYIITGSVQSASLSLKHLNVQNVPIPLRTNHHANPATGNFMTRVNMLKSYGLFSRNFLPFTPSSPLLITFDDINRHNSHANPNHKFTIMFANDYSLDILIFYDPYKVVHSHTSLFDFNTQNKTILRRECKVEEILEKCFVRTNRNIGTGVTQITIPVTTKELKCFETTMFLNHYDFTKSFIKHEKTKTATTMRFNARRNLHSASPSTVYGSRSSTCSYKKQHAVKIIPIPLKKEDIIKKPPIKPISPGLSSLLKKLTLNKQKIAQTEEQEGASGGNDAPRIGEKPKYSGKKSEKDPLNTPLPESSSDENLQLETPQIVDASTVPLPESSSDENLQMEKPQIVDPSTVSLPESSSEEE